MTSDRDSTADVWESIMIILIFMINEGKLAGRYKDTMIGLISMIMKVS